MRRLAIPFALCSLVAASGCWNEPDNSYNVLPYPDALCAPCEEGRAGTTDASSTQTSAPNGDAASLNDTTLDGPCGCITIGDWYRFDTLGLTSLDGEVHPVIATLNPLWATDIGRSELNILFEVTAVAQDSVTVRAVNGARVGEAGDICVLEETSVTFRFPREGCRLQGSDESAINVYAGDETHPKNCTTVLPVPHAIPVQKVILEAEVSESCDAITNGNVLSGVIGEAELLSTCTCLLLGDDLSDACGALDPSFESPDGLCKGCNDTYINLEELLMSFGALEYKCQTGEGGKAVCVDGYFSAYRLEASPSSCGG